MAGFFPLICILAILGAGVLGWCFVNARYYFDLIDRNRSQCAEDHAGDKWRDDASSSAR